MKKSTKIFALAAMSLAFSSASFANINPTTISKLSDKKLEFRLNENHDAIVSKLNQAITRAGGFDRLQGDADRGDGYSSYMMYQVYKYGIAHDRDPDLSFEYLSKAARVNNAQAKFELGIYFLHYNTRDKYSESLVDKTKELFVQKYKLEDPIPNPKLISDMIGFKLIDDSAKLNNPEAQYVLGIYYINGDFVQRDFDLGMFWLSRSSSNGYHDAWEAKNKVLKSKSNLESFDRIQNDAKNGDDDALVKLAEFYIDGYVVKRDMPKAISLLSAASELGNERAKDRLLEIHQHIR